MLGAAKANCKDNVPCRHYDPCPRCLAVRVLTPEDWVAVRFYQQVSDQWINQAPMGVEKGPPPLTPRLEGYEAALRLHGYPEADWSWLVDTATLLHRLVHKMETVNWHTELGEGKTFRTVTPEDVDGNT